MSHSLTTHILRYACFLLLGLFLPPESQASELEIITVEVEGVGGTRQSAIDNGLARALEKVNGVSISSSTSSTSGSVSASGQSNVSSTTVFAGQVDTQSVGVAAASGTSGRQNVAVGSATSTSVQGIGAEATSTTFDQSMSFAADQQTVDKSIDGQIKSYDVLKENPGNGEFRVTLSVSISKFKLSAEASRQRIAMLPLRLREENGDFQNAERDFSQTLVNQLTQSRKFAVLDRDYSDEQMSELGKLEEGNVPMDELAKLGNNLSADFLFVGTLEDVKFEDRPLLLKATNETVKLREQGIRMSYRLINAATGQVRFSDTYDSLELLEQGSGSKADLGVQAGKAVAAKILSSFFPTKVEQRDGRTLTLGQGGSTVGKGDRFELVAYGEEIVDSYTQEVLGRVEHKVGYVKVTEVQPTMARAIIVELIAEFENAPLPDELIVRPMIQVSGGQDARDTLIARLQRQAEEKKRRLDAEAAAKRARIKAEAARRMEALEEESEDDW